MAKDVVAADRISSVQGKAITISTQGGARVDNAIIVNTDIECSNGVIHAIDSVILP